jgi:putative transposase
MPTAPSTYCSTRERVKTSKSVSFGYESSRELPILFEEFRLMCNDAIRIALQNRPRNRFALIEQATSLLKETGLHSHYILSACEVAFSVYRNKRWKSVPYIERPFLKLDNQSYQLNHMLLRIPVAPRHFIFITLRGSEYHLSFLDNANLKRGSVTITATGVSIAFSKEVELINPVGHLGVDINERNVTISATDGFEKRFDELGEVVEIRERYREIRAKIRKQTRCDQRIGKRLLAKNGRRERNRAVQRIHKVTRKIVCYANEHELGIKTEKLTGIRRLYKRGNGQGTSLRGRMNTWVFGEIQRQIGYKAAWLGVPVYHVNPRGTSSYCLCGSPIVPLADRKLYCQKCNKTWDRDDLASKNIMACAVPQARPSMGSDDGDEATKAPIL